MSTSIIRRAVALCAALLLGFAVGAAVTASSAAAKSPTYHAYKISVLKTGGFVGVHETYTVTKWTPGSADVLATASTPEYLALLPSYQPTTPGADLFSYEVTVLYRGQHSKTVNMTDGSDCPDIMYEVIEGVESLSS